MTSKYQDIIDYQWQGSPQRIKMPLNTRAKIFMPFAALRGFEEALKKTRDEKEAQILSKKEE